MCYKLIRFCLSHLVPYLLLVVEDTFWEIVSFGEKDKSKNNKNKKENKIEQNKRGFAVDYFRIKHYQIIPKVFVVTSDKNMLCLPRTTFISFDTRLNVSDFLICIFYLPLLDWLHFSWAALQTNKQNPVSKQWVIEMSDLWWWCGNTLLSLCPQVDQPLIVFAHAETRPLHKRLLLALT